VPCAAVMMLLLLLLLLLLPKKKIRLTSVFQVDPFTIDKCYLALQKGCRFGQRLGARVVPKYVFLGQVGNPERRRALRVAQE
jgi:hypothetical protein